MQKRDIEIGMNDPGYTKLDKAPKPIFTTRTVYAALALIGALTIALVLIAAICGLILVIRGKQLSTNLSNGMDVINAFAAQFPQIAYYLALFANATDTGGAASVSEILSQGVLVQDAIPPVKYVNLTDYNARMAYRSVGACALESSEVAVFVHDITSSSLEWLEELHLLASDGYCAIAIDMLGHGHSDVPPSYGGSVMLQSDYLHAFLTLTGRHDDYSRTLILGGSGFGSAVVSYYVFTHSGAVDSLILQNPMPYAVYPSDENATMANVTGAVSSLTFTAAAYLVMHNTTLFSQLASAQICANSVCSTLALSAITSAYLDVFMQASKQTAAQGLLSLATIDFRYSYSTLITPTLIIAGGSFPPTEVPTLNYAILAQATQNLIGSYATLNIVGTASLSPLITHSHLFHKYVTLFLEGDTATCDPAPVQFADIV